MSKTKNKGGNFGKLSLDKEEQAWLAKHLQSKDLSLAQFLRYLIREYRTRNNL